ncbi:glycosyltransferase family 2 protein [Candidatus Uhrbacteria bacterium]|nr:glycosyltransferase family 2 protein [Candidatus Uhrbacteria bacterium]
MHRTRGYRMLEVVPGGLVWLTLFLAVILSFFAPVAAVVFIILFDLCWLFRVCYFVGYLLFSWRRHRRDSAVDWAAKIQVEPGAKNLWHLVFLPTYKEDIEVLRATFRSLAAAAYPWRRERFIVVLAGEERDRERFDRVSAVLASEFGAEFAKLLVIAHPKDLPDEIPGKGSNLNWAGRQAQKTIDELGIPYEKVIVSSFDIDTCPHPQYFSALTAAYLANPKPTRASYQPIALYNNNIWDAPAAVRVAAFGTTFWLMTELARPERLFTFSSHSMSFRALVDVGFWQKDIVTEDSRIFLQCLLRYDGDYRVQPLFVPVSMDAVTGESYAESLRNLYKQQRRWAWGVEHFPFLVDSFRRKPNISLAKKAYYLWNLAEGMYSWATAPLLIFILGHLPLWVASDAVRGSALFQTAPHTLDVLMTMSMIGVFATAIVSLTLLPPKPKDRTWRDWLVMALQWVLVPITFIVFGSFPAIDAQTRLMFGRYLGFNVTRKKRRDDGLAFAAQTV